MEQKILTPQQQQILGAISKERSLTNRFFLTGGTALALFYFQHRFSEDLDFFSENELESKQIIIWVQKIKKGLGFVKTEQQSLTGQEVFYFYTSPNQFVKVDFAYFPFSHLGNFQKYNQLRISSVDDICINKLQALTTRKRSRDYLDLYYCLKHLKWQANDLLRQYRLKFDVILSPEQLITSYTNVLDAQDVPIFLGKTDWNMVKKYFLNQAKKLTEQILTK